MAAFKNHACLNSIEQFPEFQCDDGNQKSRVTFWKCYIKFCLKEYGMTYVVKILSEKSYCDRVFCFPGGGFSVF